MKPPVTRGAEALGLDLDGVRSTEYLHEARAVLVAALDADEIARALRDHRLVALTRPAVECWCGSYFDDHDEWRAHQARAVVEHLLREEP